MRIFAIPNGGSRSRSEGAKFKAEGVSPGVPDLYIPAWRLWVEMKRSQGGSLSAAQQDWRDYLIEIGDGWLLCKGADDAQRQITEWAEARRLWSASANDRKKVLDGGDGGE